MPLIAIHLIEGRTDEEKEKLLTAVTRAVHESIGAPMASIRVWIQEFSPRAYMSGGELYANRKR
jgi:4-oxalocrotonate tautomerase